MVKRVSEEKETERERASRKKIKAREKVEKSRDTVFPKNVLVALEGRKVGSSKRQVRSHLVG